MLTLLLWLAIFESRGSSLSFCAHPALALASPSVDVLHMKYKSGSKYTKTHGCGPVLWTSMNPT